MTNKSKDWKPWSDVTTMSDFEIDRKLREHAGYDHKGVWRQCIQEIHFCIDDYGAPSRLRERAEG